MSCRSSASVVSSRWFSSSRLLYCLLIGRVVRVVRVVLWYGGTSGTSGTELVRGTSGVVAVVVVVVVSRGTKYRHTMSRREKKNKPHTHTASTHK